MTQDEAFELLRLCNNVFLTGEAGSGKTHLLNRYITFLHKHNISVGITASTGIAATHLNGTTIDSWSGLGIREQLTDNDLQELSHKHYLKIRLLGTKVLIIDEISMLHAYKLDMIDKICRFFHYNNLPFGGIQVVLCGDLFQLPPVSKNNSLAEFIFKSQIWNQMDLKICYLDKQFRQSDKTYIQILNSIRRNEMTDDTLKLLIKRIGHTVTSSITLPKLYTHNIDVDTINMEELEKIKDKPNIYEMTSKGHEHLVDFMKKSCLAPETLVLKKNAVVMFVRNNIKEGFVNGTLGKVVGFDRLNNPIVETLKGKRIYVQKMSWTVEENNIVKAEISQIPLRLAWAITVHKSQGMTLDAAEMDLSKSFVTGMGYVALSRLRTLAGLKLLGFNDLALQVNPQIIEFDKLLVDKSKEEVEKLKKLSWIKKIMQKRKFLYQLTS